MDEKVFQKLPSSKERTDLISIHSHINNISDEDLQVRCLIIKDENGNIKDSNHMTVPFLTKYERARILGMRIKQLNNGCDAFVKIKDNIIDTSIIANKELEEKKLPFIIWRPIPGGGFEYWRLQDLELVHF